MSISHGVVVSVILHLHARQIIRACRILASRGENIHGFSKARPAQCGWSGLHTEWREWKKLGEYCRTILRWRLPFSGFEQHVLARFVGPKARNRVSILNLWERKRTILGLREAAAENGAPFG